MKNARSHDPIEFYNDEGGEGGDKQMRSWTAGTYPGKYLLVTFDSLFEASELFGGMKESDSYADKAAMQRLGLYRATGRRFWSISRGIEKAIGRLEHLQNPDVRHTAREFLTDSLQLTRDDAMAKEFVPDDVVTPGVESTSPESADFYCHIGYLNYYAYWDMSTAGAAATSFGHVEDYVASRGQPEYSDVDGEKPPPVADAWE